MCIHAVHTDCACRLWSSDCAYMMCLNGVPACYACQDVPPSMCGYRLCLSVYVATGYACQDVTVSICSYRLCLQTMPIQAMTIGYNCLHSCLRLCYCANVKKPYTKLRLFLFLELYQFPDTSPWSLQITGRCWQGSNRVTSFAILVSPESTDVAIFTSSLPWRSASDVCQTLTRHWAIPCPVAVDLTGHPEWKG